MPIRTDLNFRLATLTQTSQDIIDDIGIALNRARMLTSDGHDRLAPDFSPTDMKNFIIGLMASNAVSEVPERVRKYSALELDGETFGDHLVGIFSQKPDEKPFVNRIVICRTYPEAHVYYQSGRLEALEGGIFISEEEPLHFTDSDEVDTGGLRIDAILNGSVLRAIAKERYGKT
jgi:hypothetical protein